MQKLFNIELDRVVFLLVCSSIYYLLFGYFIGKYFYEGGQYIYFVFVLVVVFLLGIKKRLNVALFVYLCIVFFFICYTYIMGLNNGYAFYASIIYYFAIPLVFGRNDFYCNSVYYKKTLYSLLIIVVPNALVVLLQTQGLFLDIFPLEYTGIMGVVQKRYGGVLGGSLMNGLVSGLCFVVVFYRVIEERKYSILNIMYLLLSLFSLFLSYSRGAYVFVILSVIFFLYKWGRVNGGVNKGHIFFIIIFLFAAFLFSSETVFHRLMSVMDYSQGGNALRIIYWNNTIDMIYENILTGIGFGSLTSIGVNDYSISISGVGMIAESYYLKLMAEGGLFLMISFITIVYVGAKSSFSKRANILFSSVFLALNIESMVLTSLEAPLISIIYWLCWGAVMKRSFSKLQKRHMGFAFKD